MPQPTVGRTFRTTYRIRLSDMDPTGRLRLDAVARFLQDAATDDVEETGWGAPEHLWVLRSVRIDVLTPFLEDRQVEVVTWGSGFSSLSAARRWSLAGDRGGSIEVDSLWVHLDRDGRPARIGEGFEAYAQAAAGRGAPTRLHLPDPSRAAPRTPWPLRVTDLDLMGHVNNAVYWAAVEHLLRGRRPNVREPLRARLEYRHPIDLGEEVEVVADSNGGAVSVGFVVGERVRAVAVLEAI